MEDFMGGLIPLFGIVMIILIVVGPVWIRAYFRAREQTQLHGDAACRL